MWGVGGWGVVGGNVIVNLQMSPEACPLPRETDPVTDAVLTKRHLCHHHTKGQTEGKEGRIISTC